MGTIWQTRGHYRVALPIVKRHILESVSAIFSAKAKKRTANEISVPFMLNPARGKRSDNFQTSE